MENIQNVEAIEPQEEITPVFNGDFAYLAITTTIMCTYVIINTLLFVA